MLSGLLDSYDGIIIALANVKDDKFTLLAKKYAT